jgi:hypothetical protein
VTIFGRAHQAVEMALHRRNGTVEPRQRVEDRRKPHDSPIPQTPPSPERVGAHRLVGPTGFHPPAPPTTVPIANAMLDQGVRVPPDRTLAISHHQQLADPLSWCPHHPRSATSHHAKQLAHSKPRRTAIPGRHNPLASPPTPRPRQATTGSSEQCRRRQPPRRIRHFRLVCHSLRNLSYG